MQGKIRNYKVTKKLQVAFEKESKRQREDN